MTDLIELSQRDIDLCAAMSKWIGVARKFGGPGYGPDWLPREPDIRKSRLFWRIRSGKEPLAYPPPCAYSCPWYELIEDIRPHSTLEVITLSKFAPGKALICQSLYDIIEQNRDDLTLGYGPYRFTASVGGNSISRVPELENTTSES